MLLLLVYASLFSWQSWREAKEGRLQALAMIMDLGERTLDWYFQRHERDLARLARALFDGRGGLIDLARARDLIGRFRQDHPDLIAASLTRADGQVLIDTEPAPGAPLPFVGDLPSFTRSREEFHAGKSFSIARPIFGSVVMQWVVPLRYGVRGKDGTVTHILTANLPLSNAKSFWKDVPMPENAAVALLRDDGYLVSRHPEPDKVPLEEVYGKPRTGTMIEHLRKEGFPVSGKIEGVSSLEGKGILIVFRRLSHYPVSFAVIEPLENFHAAWWAKVKVPLMIIFLFFAYGYVVYRWMLKRQRAWEAEVESADNALEQASEREHEARLRLEGIIDSAMDAIMSIDEAHRIVQYNHASEKMFGYPAAEMIGQMLDRLIPSSARTTHSSWVHEFGKTGTTSRRMGALGTVQALRSNGEAFPVEASISKVPAGNGHVYTAILRDITERKQAEERIRALVADLEQRNRELEAFSYSVAHDLRTPLRAIEGFGQILMKKYGDSDGSLHGYLARISHNTLRMAALIDGLLELSRVSRTALAARTIDLSQEAVSVLTRFRNRDPARQIDTEVQPGIVVNADPHMMSVLLENLLGNAWKFTSGNPNAKILIAVEQYGCERAIVVHDNGVGFDMAYADKLFGAFQRLHRADDFKGTGIGLATARRIVERHNGRIWAESAVGEGARFYFVLPGAGAVSPPLQ